MNNQRLGMGLIALGAVLIVLRITGFTFASLLWPMWVLVPGALILYTAFREETAQPALAVPGALVVGTGLILFFLNLTDRWEAWAYMWALYPVFVGTALHYVGRHNRDEKLMNSGKHAARSGLFMLVGFGLFFELVIFGGLGFLDSALLPAILIGGGLYLLYARDKVRLSLDWLNGSKPKGKPKRELPDDDEKTDINPDLRRRMDEALAEDDHSVTA